MQKKMEIDLEDEQFQKEVEQILVEDYKILKKYMSLIVSSVNELQQETKMLQKQY